MPTLIPKTTPGRFSAVLAVPTSSCLGSETIFRCHTAEVSGPARPGEALHVDRDGISLLPLAVEEQIQPGLATERVRETCVRTPVSTVGSKQKASVRAEGPDWESTEDPIPSTISLIPIRIPTNGRMEVQGHPDEFELDREESTSNATRSTLRSTIGPIYRHIYHLSWKRFAPFDPIACYGTYMGQKCGQK